MHPHGFHYTKDNERVSEGPTIRWECCPAQVDLGRTRGKYLVRLAAPF